MQRESLGAWLNLELYSKRNDINSKHITFRNDCQSGLFGLQKGSKSAMIQYASVQIAETCIVEGAFPYFLHVSGKRLIEEGLDDGSRTHAEQLRGPACNDEVRSRVRTFARRLGLELTIDFFASSCNAMDQWWQDS